MFFWVKLWVILIAIGMGGKLVDFLHIQHILPQFVEEIEAWCSFQEYKEGHHKIFRRIDDFRKRHVIYENRQFSWEEVHNPRFVSTIHQDGQDSGELDIHSDRKIMVNLELLVLSLFEIDLVLNVSEELFLLLQHMLEYWEVLLFVLNGVFNHRREFV